MTSTPEEVDAAEPVETEGVGTPEDSSSEGADAADTIDCAEPETADDASAEWNSAEQDAERITAKIGASKTVGTLVEKFGKKRLAIAGGVVVVVLVALIALFGVFNDGPSAPQIKADIEQDGISWPGAGVYGHDEAFEIASIDVVEKKRVDLPADARTFFGDSVGNTGYEITAKVDASNGAVEANATISGGYIKYEGKWQPMSLSAESMQSKATQGVSEEKVAQQAQDLLREASADQRGELAQIYADAKVKVGEVEFDKDSQACTVKVDYSTDSAFSSAKATVAAKFAYENNAWVLRSAKAGDGAKTISYDKLVGTWKGSFEKTTHGKSGGSNCYGAKGSAPELVITSVDAKSLKVEGAFTGLVHDHGMLNADADSCEGDKVVEALPFTGTLEKNEYLYGEVGASCTLVVDGGNSMKITFGFGTNSDDDPNGAYVEVLYCYQCDLDAFFLPGAQEKWEDTYRLEKAE